MSNDGFIEFGFGDNDESIGNQKFERFKGKEGENYRVSFVWWNTKPDGTPDLDSKTPRFVAAKRIYIPGVGYVLDKGPEYAQFGQSKVNIATIIVAWPLNRKGELDKDRFVGGDVSVMPWIFGKDKYEQLRRRHDEFPFGSYDMTIACTDTQYQKMDLSPCRESLYRKLFSPELAVKMKGLTDSISAQVDAIGKDMNNILARDVSIEKIREKLGGAPASSGSRGGGGGGHAANAANSAAIDDLLNDV